MSKATTTLMDILQSELINDGHNEFFNNGHLTLFDDDFQFIKKVMRFDLDIQKIVTKKFFGGFIFSNGLTDLFFKKLFINEFLHREHNSQTLEIFATKNISLCMSYEAYLTELITNLAKYILMTSDNTSDSEQLATTKYRNLYADLPQNMINLDLNTDTLDFATNNTISNTQNKTTGNVNTKNQQYNLDNLLKSRDLLTELLKEFDKKLFMQRW